MGDAQPQVEFEIDREAVYRYMVAYGVLVSLLALIWVFGLGLILAPLCYWVLGPLITRRQVAALRYRLDGTTLRIDQGFIFLSRKAIPLDRITDVVMAQGPLARRCGVWLLYIQTAGSGQPMPEGRMLGVVEPEKVRDLILARRDEAARAARDPGL